MTDYRNKDRKCGLYSRVASVDQAAAKNHLNEQEKELKSYCSYQGWNNMTVYRDAGCSGRSLIRPEFQRMLTDIRDGKINTVIITNLDRLSRSLTDNQTIRNACLEKGVDIVSLRDHLIEGNV